MTLNPILKGFNRWSEVLKSVYDGTNDETAAGFHSNVILEALPLAHKESVKLKRNEADFCNVRWFDSI